MSLLKILGAVLIFSSTTGMGWLYAKRYADRPMQLRQLQAAFEWLETDILYRSQPLPDSFWRIAMHMRSPIKEWFLGFVDYLEAPDGPDTAESWEKSLSEITQQTSLGKNDLEALRQFGRNLGSSDRDDQAKHIRALIQRLQIEEMQARNDQEKYEKLSRTLGMLGGLFIIILMY